MPIQTTLTGTVLAPRLRVEFPYGGLLPNGKSAMEWVRNLPDRHFEKAPAPHWVITGTGNQPGRTLSDAGLDWVADPDSELSAVTDLRDVWLPVMQLSRRWPGTVVISPRFAGYALLRSLIGPGAVWDRDKRHFKVRVTDLVDADGAMHPKLAERLQGPVHLLPGLADQVRRRLGPAHPAAVELAQSDCVDAPGDQHLGARAQELIAELRQDTGLDLPGDFGLALYPYQAGGAWATAGNVRNLNDEPGLGKGGTIGSGILTPSGWATYGQVRSGSQVIGSDGRPTEVTGVFPRGELPVYRVTMNDGSSTVVDGDHLWDITMPGWGRAVMATRDVARMISEGLEPQIPMVQPVRFDRDVDGMAADPLDRLEQLRREFGGRGRQRDEGRVLTVTDDELDRLRTLVESLGGQVIALEPAGASTNVLAVLPEVFGGNLSPRRTIASVEPAGTAQVVCISVAAPDSLYVTEHCIVTHNTRQALAAAAIHDADRVLVICPPLVLRNWAREASAALGPIYVRKFGGAFTPTGPRKNPDPDWTTIIHASRKVPAFPEHGVLMVADSLLASRPELAENIKGWAPEAIISDEVHRLGNWATSRGSAVRWLTEALDCPSFALTGTPMQAKPTEMANQLALSGALERDFGSVRQYLGDYTREDPFGGRVAIKRELPGLRDKLRRGVMVRRLKSVVLPQLPRKLRAIQYVDISRKLFDEAHKELEATIAEWFSSFEDSQGRLPTDPELEEWTKTNVGLLSPLRVAAGRSKVKPAIEIITALMDEQGEERSGDGGFANPVIVWAHHQEVLQDLRDAMPDVWPAAVIDGSVNSDRRTAIADRFQDGQIAVLFCSIVAAGFGITLTRGCQSYFVESDWTPALIAQAEDRQARIGQTRPVTVTTLISEETLDLHVRAVLHAKEKDLDVVLPGSDHNVTHVDALWSSDGTLEQVEMGTVSAVKNEAQILLSIAAGVRAKRRHPAGRR